MSKFTFMVNISISRVIQQLCYRSLCPTITWHALTVNVDDDNGVPKVQWRNSRIERMYLDALSCWRRQVRWMFMHNMTLRYS
jgi:hypothetical protein